MKFERGIDPKEAIGIGLRIIDVEFIGYNSNQPHNKEVTVDILKDVRMLKWGNVSTSNIGVYYFPVETEDADYIIYSPFRSKYYVERNLQDLLNNPRIGFFRYQGILYPLR